MNGVFIYILTRVNMTKLYQNRVQELEVII